LIHGWSESDACLAPDPKVWWQPYFANSAFAARGFKDIARAWLDTSRLKSVAAMRSEAEDWMKRSQTLQDATVASIEKNIKPDLKPPVHRATARREIEVSRRAGPGAPEPATVAASSLRRTASG
jgi:hypothetical protein